MIYALCSFRSFYNALKNTAKDLDDRGQQLMEEDKALDDEIKHLQEVCRTKATL